MKHGRVRYQKRKCRCQICRDANTAYTRRYRRRLSSKDNQDSASIVEPDNQPYRDETIPAQIMAELRIRDMVTYTDDGSEGWTVEELASFMESTEDVECVIQGNHVRVSKPYVPETPDWTIPESQEWETVANGPARPRIVPRTPIASGPARPRVVPMGVAPTVPIASNRTVNSTTQSVNRQEPWGL